MDSKSRGRHNALQGGNVGRHALVVLAGKLPTCTHHVIVELSAQTESAGSTHVAVDPSADHPPPASKAHAFQSIHRATLSHGARLSHGASKNSAERGIR